MALGPSLNQNDKIVFDDIIKVSTQSQEFTSIIRRIRFKSEVINKSLRLTFLQNNGSTTQTLQVDNQVQPVLDVFNKEGIISIQNIDANSADCLSTLIIEVAKYKDLTTSTLRKQILETEINHLSYQVELQHLKSLETNQKIDEALKSFEQKNKQVSDITSQFSTKHEASVAGLKNTVDANLAKVNSRIEELKKFEEAGIQNLEKLLKENQKTSTSKVDAYKLDEQSKLDTLTKDLRAALDLKVKSLEEVQNKWKENAEIKLGRVLGELSSDKLTQSFKRAHKFKRVGAWFYLSLTFITFVIEGIILVEAYKVHKESKEKYQNTVLSSQKEPIFNKDDLRSAYINEQVDMMITRGGLLLPLICLSVYLARKEKSTALLAERYHRIASILETLGAYTEEMQNIEEREKIRQSVALELFSTSDLKSENDGEKIVSEAIKLISAMKQA